nr:MAG TPA: hypothetical protein [Caudoviricetes sp.]
MLNRKFGYLLYSTCNNLLCQPYPLPKDTIDNMDCLAPSTYNRYLFYRNLFLHICLYQS